MKTHFLPSPDAFGDSREISVLFNPKSKIQILKSNRGTALVIVLAFIVLLTGLTLAFFSQALSARQISNSSANQTKAELFAQGAVDMIVGDLKQEILVGSTATQVAGGTLYLPTSNTFAVPALALTGTTGITGTSFAPNLVKRSAYSQAFYTGGIARASQASTTGTSQNGRNMTLARWNKALYLPKANTTVTNDTDFTPMNPSAAGYTGTNAFVAPDWILVTRGGDTPVQQNLTTPKTVTWSDSSSTSVVGRYAYTIYDEGGLLDANAVGYPSTSNASQITYKPALAYADLSQLPPTTGSSNLVQLQNALVGWRNYTATTPPGTMALPNISAASASNYFQFIVSNTTGFLTTGTATYNNQTDRMFTSRQQLINWVTQGIAPTGPGAIQKQGRYYYQNALQYLTHFSRALEQPSFAPDPNRPKVLDPSKGGNSLFGNDDLVNPKFLGVRVQANKTFTRNDNSSAVSGEPLVKKRFALNRLAWLTYSGPSATRNTVTTGTTGADGDIGLMKLYGITKEWLDQGNASNIQKYFGLAWSGSTWQYNVHNGPSGSGPKGVIMMLGDIANLSTPHEPDFFELLKATIHVGSLGKALVTSGTTVTQDSGAPQSDQPYNYNYYAEHSVDYQVLQIGANIISQFQPANYPPRIVFDDGSGYIYTPRTIVGVSNLPYLNMIFTGVLQIQAPNIPPLTTTGATGIPTNSVYKAGDQLTDPGVGALMQLPVIWNPHDPSSSTGASGAGPTKFRVVADSAAPDQADGGTHNRYFVYAKSNGTNSYEAYSTSPGGSWYRDPTGGGNISHQLTAANTQIDFNVTSGTATLFPEPVVLMTPATTPTTISDGNGNNITVGVGLNSGESPLMKSDPAVSGTFSNGGLPSYIADSYAAGKIANASYIGLYLGAFPLAWMTGTAGTAPSSAAQNGAYFAQVGTTPSFDACYMTYRMQYQDPGGIWVTYDTKYGKTTNAAIQLRVGFPSLFGGNGSASSTGEPGAGSFWAFATDPRTSRFGLQWNGTFPAAHGQNSPFLNNIGHQVMYPLPYFLFEGHPSPTGGWLDNTSARTLTIRPDGQSGFYAMAGWPYTTDPVTAGKTNSDGKTAGWMAWVATDYQGVPGINTGGSYPGLAPGLLSQNNTDIPYNIHMRGGYHGDSNPYTPNYYADPDGMVRRAMGAFVPPTGFVAGATTVGLPAATNFAYTTVPDIANNPSITAYTPPAPSAQVTSQAQSRPYFLHRPFYSVAELGYVFSDTPWRNLDFFTAESGNAALLDVFCINDTGDANALVAGKVNLNTRQKPVMQAVLAGSYLDPVQPAAAGATGRLASNTVNLVATALVARTSDTTTTGAGPLQNMSELVGKWTASTPIIELGGLAHSEGVLPSANGFYDGKLSYSGFSGGIWDSTNRTPKMTTPAEDIYSAYMNSSAFTTNANKNGTQETAAYIQRFREAPIRALASCGQTRVWNLMIDVVAQTGRYPQSASDLNKFVVEGEQRYWVHVAIDRYTGQIIDKQTEVVKE